MRWPWKRVRRIDPDAKTWTLTVYKTDKGIERVRFETDLHEPTDSVWEAVRLLCATVMWWLLDNGDGFDGQVRETFNLETLEQ